MLTYRDTVHQLNNGRFIVAHWCDSHFQWKSFNRRGWSVPFAARLEELPGLGVPTYAQRSSARRTARRCYEVEA